MFVRFGKRTAQKIHVARGGNYNTIGLINSKTVYSNNLKSLSIFTNVNFSDKRNCGYSKSKTTRLISTGLLLCGSSYGTINYLTNAEAATSTTTAAFSTREKLQRDNNNNNNTGDTVFAPSPASGSTNICGPSHHPNCMFKTETRAGSASLTRSTS